MKHPEKLLEVPTICDGCGLCCMSQNMLPWASVGLYEGYDLPDELWVPLCLSDTDSPRFGDDTSQCIWFDRLAGTCMHYDHRPPPCREMIVGSDGCMRWRKRAYAVEMGE